MSNVKNLTPSWASNSGTTFGDIVFCSDGQYRVKTDKGLLPAMVSASCLLSPEVGDRVILLADSEQLYITSILVKASQAEQVLTVPGQLTVNAKAIKFNSEETFEVEAKTVGFSASVANFKFGVLNQLALKMALVAEKLDVTAQRIRRTAKQEYTLFDQQHERVTDTKNVQAGRWIQRVHKQWIARSERTTITASKEVKLDGKRIDLG